MDRPPQDLHRKKSNTSGGVSGKEGISQSASTATSEADLKRLLIINMSSGSFQSNEVGCQKSAPTLESFVFLIFFFTIFIFWKRPNRNGLKERGARLRQWSNRLIKINGTSRPKRKNKSRPGWDRNGEEFIDLCINSRTVGIGWISWEETVMPFVASFIYLTAFDNWFHNINSKWYPSNNH